MPALAEELRGSGRNLPTMRRYGGRTRPSTMVLPCCHTLFLEERGESTARMGGARANPRQAWACCSCWAPSTRHIGSSWKIWPRSSLFARARSAPSQGEGAGVGEVGVAGRVRHCPGHHHRGRSLLSRPGPALRRPGDRRLRRPSQAFRTNVAAGRAGDSMPYWPSYADLTPAARRACLVRRRRRKSCLAATRLALSSRARGCPAQAQRRSRREHGEGARRCRSLFAAIGRGRRLHDRGSENY